MTMTERWQHFLSFLANEKKYWNLPTRRQDTSANLEEALKSAFKCMLNPVHG